MPLLGRASIRPAAREEMPRSRAHRMVARSVAEAEAACRPSPLTPPHRATSRTCGGRVGTGLRAPMDIASSVATSRLVAQQRAMDVVADNIANANTPGFKAERVQFSDWLEPPERRRHAAGRQPIAYTQDRATWREQQAGTITHTGNPLDLALTGDGYFTVNTPARAAADARRTVRPDAERHHRGLQPATPCWTPTASRSSSRRPTRASPSPATARCPARTARSARSASCSQAIRCSSAPRAARCSVSGSTTAPVAVARDRTGRVEESNVQPVLEMTRMMDGERQFEFMTQFVQAEGDRQQNCDRQAAAAAVGS